MLSQEAKVIKLIIHLYEQGYFQNKELFKPVNMKSKYVLMPCVFESTQFAFIKNLEDFIKTHLGYLGIFKDKVRVKASYFKYLNEILKEESIMKWEIVKLSLQWGIPEYLEFVFEPETPGVITTFGTMGKTGNLFGFIIMKGGAFILRGKGKIVKIAEYPFTIPPQELNEIGFYYDSPQPLLEYAKKALQNKLRNVQVIRGDYMLTVTHFFSYNEIEGKLGDLLYAFLPSPILLIAQEDEKTSIYLFYAEVFSYITPVFISKYLIPFLKEKFEKSRNPAKTFLKIQSQVKKIQELFIKSFPKRRKI